MTMAPIDRAKIEIHEVFRHAEKYRVGILQKISTFGEDSLDLLGTCVVV